MNLNKFTEKAQEAVLASPPLASELNHAQAEPEHLLRRRCSSNATASCRRCCRSSMPIRQGARTQLARIPRQAAQGLWRRRAALSPRLRVVLDAAQAEAQTMQDEFVSTEHLLLGILSDPGSRLAVDALKQRGVHARQGARRR